MGVGESKGKQGREEGNRMVREPVRRRKRSWEAGRNERKEGRKKRKEKRRKYYLFASVTRFLYEIKCLLIPVT